MSYICPYAYIYTDIYMYVYIGIYMTLFERNYNNLKMAAIGRNM